MMHIDEWGCSPRHHDSRPQSSCPSRLVHLYSTRHLASMVCSSGICIALEGFSIRSKGRLEKQCSRPNRSLCLRAHRCGIPHKMWSRHNGIDLVTLWRPMALICCPVAIILSSPATSLLEIYQPSMANSCRRQGESVRSPSERHLPMLQKGGDNLKMASSRSSSLIGRTKD